MLIIDVEDDFNDSDVQNDSGSNPERHTELMIRIKTCINYETAAQTSENQSKMNVTKKLFILLRSSLHRRNLKTSNEVCSSIF